MTALIRRRSRLYLYLCLYPCLCLCLCYLCPRPCPRSRHRPCCRHRRNSAAQRARRPARVRQHRPDSRSRCPCPWHHFRGRLPRLPFSRSRVQRLGGGDACGQEDRQDADRGGGRDFVSHRVAPSRAGSGTCLINRSSLKAGRSHVPDPQSCGDSRYRSAVLSGGESVASLVGLNIRPREGNRQSSPAEAVSIKRVEGYGAARWHPARTNVRKCA